jgi:hypothetical protein
MKNGQALLRGCHVLAGPIIEICYGTASMPFPHLAWASPCWAATQCELTQKKKKLRGYSPQANYTD